jgi:hypothetical protein
MLLPSRVLRATVVATLSLVASAAHAVPYMPTELPATFDTLSIVNTGAGASFAVVVGSSGFMYTQNASAGLEDTTPALVRLTTRRSSTTTTAYATRQGTDVRVADGVVTFHFDPAASPPTATDLLALGDQTAVGLGESDTNAPKIALWGPTGLSVTTVGQDISRATPVGTPDLKPLVGDIGKFWANDTFGVVAYASRASGVRVVMLDGKGTPSAAPPLTLNGANVSKIAVTPLGTDVLVTTTKELSLTVSRIDADAKVVKEQDLPLDTVGVVTDASAGSGPDALIVQHDRTERVSLSSWSALSSAGATNPWTLVPERVSGRFSGGGVQHERVHARLRCRQDLHAPLGRARWPHGREGGGVPSRADRRHRGWGRASLARPAEHEPDRRRRRCGGGVRVLRRLDARRRRSRRWPPRGPRSARRHGSTPPHVLALIDGRTHERRRCGFPREATSPLFFREIVQVSAGRSTSSSVTLPRTLRPLPSNETSPLPSPSVISR